MAKEKIIYTKYKQKYTGILVLGIWLLLLSFGIFKTLFSLPAELQLESGGLFQQDCY